MSALGPLEPIAGLVLNLHHQPEHHDIYIGRSSRGLCDAGWGNPIPLGDQGREAVLIAYFEWLQSDDPVAVGLRARLRSGELAGKTLACWCAPKLCHGHILAGLGNGLVEETKQFVQALIHARDSQASLF